MVSTKDLRDIFDQFTSEAGKRAGDAIDDMNIGRRTEPPGLLWFGLGLVLGAAIGMIAAFLVSPYSGQQARAKIGEQVERMRKQREETVAGNGGAVYTTPTAAERS